MQLGSGVPAAIFWGGLTVGVLDGLDAVVTWALRGVPATRVFQGIAAGLVGRESAFGGGLPTAALGLALHFFIATTATAVFVLASRKLAFLVRHAVPSGLAFGLGVFFFMYYVVMPLAGIKRGAFTWGSLANALGAHFFLVGLPIGLITRKVAGLPPSP